MKVIILYQFNINGHLVDTLCQNLNKHGIEADSLNVITWKYKSNIKKSAPFIISLFRTMMVIPKVRSVLLKIFRTRVLLSLSEKYHIIDIHFFSDIYDKLIDELKHRGKTVKITIWGSDFYRADKTRQEIQRIFYKRVDIIQTASQQIRHDFLEIYPECADKIRVAHFGISQFEVINELFQKGNSELYKKELGLPPDKIILTCGTNGSKGHQHLLILENINKLANEIKKQIFLLIPMTYGYERLYLKTIRQKADSLGLPYKLYSSMLSPYTIAKISIVSDILITIQKTDAFSAAVQEHLYAGSILIAGDWLPYMMLREKGIFYLTTSLEALSVTVSDTIINTGEQRSKCQENRHKMAMMSSWNAVIKDWCVIYNELIVN